MLSLPETVPPIPLIDQKRLISLAKILEARGHPFNDIHKWLMAVYLMGYLQRGSEAYAEIVQQLDTAILVMGKS